MSESLFPLTELREQASRGGRAIDGGAAFTPVRDDVLLALIEVAEAAREVIDKSADEEGVEWIGLLPSGQQRLWNALVAARLAE